MKFRAVKHMKKRSKAGCFAGRLAVAFGGGLIIAFILPAEWIVAILAVVLIIFGICGFK